MEKFILRFNPVLKKIWLQLIAGLMWSAVGLMLSTIAISWIKMTDWPFKLINPIVGVALAVCVYHWGFSKIAIKNTRRIEAYVKEKVCLFAFQKWSSYPLVVFMISLGIFLRKYSHVPKPALAILYLGIGGGLFLSSLHYFQVVYQKSNT